MKNLYIWHRRALNIEVYPPTEDYIFKSKFETDKPKKYYTENWKEIDDKGNYKNTLPDEMYLVITAKKYKGIHFDYYDIRDVKLVSETFLSFLNENGMDNTYYGKAVLHIFNLNGKPLTDKNYFALRFIKYDDEYFNFHEETKELAMDSIDSYFSSFDFDDEGGKEIPKEEDTGEYLYPDIEVKLNKNGKNIFVINPFYYSDGLLFNGMAKKYILEHFNASEIYKTEDFPKICNHYNFEELPENNKYRMYK
jgi:hypothetical protein